MKNKLNLVGYASGIAANDTGCGDGPLVLQQSDLLQQLAAHGTDAKWLDILMPDSKLLANKVLCVADLCKRLAHHTQKLIEQQQPFFVMGGDHSAAIGTWSGVANAKSVEGHIGLIWVDAHLDSHTPESSETGNIHGMPVACLMGYGDLRLTGVSAKNAKLLPQNITIIGARSFEPGELSLLKKLGVKIIYSEELEKISLADALKEARMRAMDETVGYGISIDLDAIDPEQAPGVGTPEKNGLSAKLLVECLTAYADDPHLLGAEIVEFNPHHDKNHLTQKVIVDLLRSLVK